jgi:signal recognition particle receptor subunit beta
MSLASPARSDQVVKLLVPGPFAARTTTLIRTNSQTPDVATDVRTTTADEASVTARPSVVMEFATSRGSDGHPRIDLLMFGSPGRSRFGRMTDVVEDDVDAVISIVDGTAHVRSESA